MNGKWDFSILLPTNLNKTSHNHSYFIDEIKLLYLICTIKSHYLLFKLVFYKTCILQNLELNLVCLFFSFWMRFIDIYSVQMRLNKINEIEQDTSLIFVPYWSIPLILFILLQTVFSKWYGTILNGNSLAWKSHSIH